MAKRRLEETEDQRQIRQEQNRERTGERRKEEKEEQRQTIIKIKKHRNKCKGKIARTGR
jgi:hypothetical protein